MTKELLLISLFTCHWLADYTWLSTSWMLNAKRLGKPLIPIFCHALVHATLMYFTLAILYLSISGVNLTITNDGSITILDKLFLFQLFTHFLIDIWKGRMNGWFPSLQNPANKLHWVVFGFDQLLHSIVIILMVYFTTK